MIREQIENKLSTEFKPRYLKVVNESHRHNVPVNSSSHFKVILVSDFFIGKSLLRRHRSIYSVLSKELNNGVYSATLFAHTQKEWEERQGAVLVSPCCHGVNQLIEFEKFDRK